MGIRKSTILTIIMVLAVSLAPSLNSEAASVADFYRGKTVEVYVGVSPGGGYSTFAQILVSYLGKHIPGNPTVIVKHMPGAAGMKALSQHRRNCPISTWKNITFRIRTGENNS